MKIGILSVACSLGPLALRAASPEPLSTPAKDLRSDTWTATDALGRALPGFDECGPRKGNRVVGMFYFVTHNNNGAKQGPFDVTKILAADPEHPKWGGGTHYWGEPEAGYYIMKDEWIIRRHARQLCDAGVDLIVLDNTNDHIYEDVFCFIADVFRRMRAEGEPTPQIACLASQKSVELLWDKIYSRGLYADLWFRWKGKPLLLFGQHVTGNRQQVNDVRFPKAITDFFTIRQSWAWTTLRWYDDGHDEWPWVDHYPQSVGWSESPDRAEYVPVAVAEHPLSNIGRSFHDGVQPETDRYDVTPDTDKGLYFAEQWSRALEVDPEFVFVTGWNEWTAGKYQPGGEGKTVSWLRRQSPFYFVDQYNAEFNRCIHPVKGGYTDNYYMQMAQNLRRYKGARPIPRLEGYVEAKADGDFGEWDAVTTEYRDTRGDVFHRDAKGYAGLHYVDTSGRNDILTAKVAVGRRAIGFYAETADALTPSDGNNWMLLLIDADNDSSTGWYGYDFVINKKVKDGRTTTLMRYDSDSEQWIEAAELPYRYEGNRLEVIVPRKLLGLTGDGFTFDFKWSDNAYELEDPISLCLHGDTAPNRRFNYRCIWNRR